MRIKLNLIVIKIILVCFLSKSAIAEWREQCLFPKENCEIINQPKLNALFKRSFMHIGSNNENVLTLDTRFAEGSLARLITPFIVAPSDAGQQSRTVCVQIEYLVDGDGIGSFSILQQNQRETNPVYEMSDSKRGKWVLALLDVRLKQQQQYRYFVDVKVNAGRDGIVVIKDFHYSSGKCSVKKKN